MRFIKVLGLILLFVLSMAFFVQNTEILSQTMALQLDLFAFEPWMSVPLPFYILILISFAIGALFTLAFFVIDKIQTARQLKDCRNQLAKMTQEVNSLRNLPIEDQGYAQPASPEPAPSAESENHE